MEIERTTYFEDLVSGWEQANKTAAIGLIRRCLVKNIVAKNSFEWLLNEVNNWDGRKI